jgi:hypothetical protein
MEHHHNAASPDNDTSTSICNLQTKGLSTLPDCDRPDAPEPVVVDMLADT